VGDISVKILILSPNQLKKFNWTHQLLRDKFSERHDVVYYGEGFPGYIPEKPIDELVKKDYKNNFDVIVTHSVKFAEQFLGLENINNILKVHIIVDYFPHSSSGTFDRNHKLFERDKYHLYLAPYMHEVRNLKENGYQNSRFFPHSIDPNFYSNDKSGCDKIYDLFSVFSLRNDCYPNRRLLLKELWKISDKYKIFKSRVFRTEYIDAICSSKICLGNNDIFKSTNIRVFEILACRGFFLTDESEDFRILGFKDEKI
jgi:hypothetical protein